ncbi:putative multidrug export ATP-binding/permease protein [compost metagenome]
MSIWENIAIGTSADRAEAIRAAKSVGIDDFISSLAEGYDTVVGERGAKLSTGQRQRIGIARLALRDSSVILLDEPTSALDSMNEQSLLSVVSSSFGGKTIVMIAHRLKSIAGADCILVMRDGQIVEHGTHEQLIDRGNYYFELWNAQNNSAIFAQG